MQILIFSQTSDFVLTRILATFSKDKLRQFAKANGVRDALTKPKLMANIVSAKSHIEATIEFRIPENLRRNHGRHRLVITTKTGTMEIELGQLHPRAFVQWEMDSQGQVTFKNPEAIPGWFSYPPNIRRQTLLSMAEEIRCNHRIS